MRSTVTGKSLPLLGGALCLDFVNTIDPRLKPPREDFLATFEQLSEWGRYVGLLTPIEERSLLAAGAADPSLAADVHERAIELREALYRLLRLPGRGQSQALQVVNQERERTAAGRRLERDGNRYRLAWRRGAMQEQLLGSVVRSAADLLTSSELHLVRQCSGDGCGWLFLDRSKAHRRRWCSMAICGNRAKAQRHRQRVRAASG